MTGAEGDLRGVRVALVPLGCPKNDVDAEYMLGLLAAAGATVVADPSAADAVLVNTCAFIRPACDEAIGALLETMGALGAAEIEDNRSRAILCTGCLPARYGTELADEMPELDGLVAPGAMGDIVAAVAAALRGERLVLLGRKGVFCQAGWPRHLIGPPWTRSVKIADGCSHACSFCTLPALRGRFVSQPEDALVAEAEALLEQGALELCLIAQDTTGYGRDLGLEAGLPRLLERLAPIVGPDRWLRVQYLHPDTLTPDVVEAILGLGPVVPYFDLPFQHSSPSVLHAMLRGGDRAAYTALIEDIRLREPSAAIRATFIAGFPGETEADFHDLLGFIADIEADHVALFPYYAEEGTKAERLPGHVGQPETRRRLGELTDTAHAVAQRRSDAFVGQWLRTLIEAGDGGSQYRGRTFRDAPEVDGTTYVLSHTPLPTGTFSDVLVTSAEVSDLFGRTQ